ncbi:39S ribosomal protein L22, mitochondrial [Elasticomyces elasticus]|nr:hypothetical protein LTR28_004969 [Elasticomyces elasticus]KAK4991716.1 39S ribosomal protein L22, mitochondrial [Elasticomyces elasticus]
MSTRTSSRRVVQQAVSTIPLRPASFALPHAIPLQCQRRTFLNLFRKGRGPEPAPTNPVLEDYLKRKPMSKQQARPKPGDLASSSIFDSEKASEAPSDAATAALSDSLTQVGGVPRDRNNMAARLDPDPVARKRWERKMVIRQLRHGARLNKTQFVKRTERESLSRSHNFKTSVKKLGMLSRQIAGKTIDDAIAQMRFSKKKVAQQVLKHLEHARDEAIVKRGMGLALVQAPTRASESLDSISGTSTSTTSSSPAEAPTEIQLKNGKRHAVTDLSKIYVDQAWVGRGPFGLLPDYRARGRVYTMRPPFTSLSVLLKEEATRVREYGDREEKRRRLLLGRKPWTQLPDRKLIGQRQWFSW